MCSPSFQEHAIFRRNSLMSSTKFIKSRALSGLLPLKEKFSYAQMVALRLELVGEPCWEELPRSTWPEGGRFATQVCTLYDALEAFQSKTADLISSRYLQRW